MDENIDHVISVLILSVSLSYIFHLKVNLKSLVKQPGPKWKYFMISNQFETISRLIWPSKKLWLTCYKQLY